MATTQEVTYPWVILSLNSRLFGISTEFIKTMVLVPEVTAVPNAAEYVRGVINLRGKVLTLIDLRMKLGMIPFVTEIDNLCSLLQQREDDHKKWIATLESEVQSGAKISVQTDPHKCGFGKWYDTFKTENLVLTLMLKKFDEPHQRIHAIAKKAEALLVEKNTAGAQQLIDICKVTDLDDMIKLFNLTRNYLRSDIREIAVVLEGEKDDFAIVVDSVESVESLQEENVEDASIINIPSLDKELIPKIGRRTKTDQIVFLLNHRKIISA